MAIPWYLLAEPSRTFTRGLLGNSIRQAGPARVNFRPGPNPRDSGGLPADASTAPASAPDERSGQAPSGLPGPQGQRCERGANMVRTMTPPACMTALHARRPHWRFFEVDEWQNASVRSGQPPLAVVAWPPTIGCRRSGRGHSICGRTRVEVGQQGDCLLAVNGLDRSPRSGSAHESFAAAWPSRS